jgi:hypothetical protein
MYIELKNIKTFWGGEGSSLELPSNIIRFIEFEKVVVFLLDEDGKRDKIAGVKFSQEGGINHYYIAWEFQIIDKNNKVYRFDYFVRKTHKGQELVYCLSGWGVVGYFLNPDTGEIVDLIPIK